MELPLHPLLISPSWPAESSTNGVVVHVQQLVEEFRRLGHRPLIATPQFCPTVNKAACAGEVIPLVDSPVARITDRLRYSMGGSIPVDVVMARRIRTVVNALHREGRIDLLQMEEAWGTPAHLAGRLPVPVNVRLHGPWFLTGAADGVRQDAAFRRRVEMEGRAVAVASGVSAPSEFVLNATREHYQLPLVHAQVIPNSARLVPDESHWTGEASDQPVILFVGRFDAIKGGDLILQAFAAVHQKLPEARLIFIGPDNGIRLQGDQLQHLPEFIARQLSPSAARRVEYLGRQDSTVIQAWRRRANVTVIASRFDNFPNTVLEAISHGSPTIATSVGGIPEIIRHEVTGLLTPPGSPEALATAILRILEDHPLALRLGRAACADARTRFHPSRCGELMLATYTESLAERRKSA